MAEKVIVHVPTPLRGQADGQARLELAGATVREVLVTLADRYPALGGRLFNERNEVNRFVNVFLNDEDVRFLQNLDTPVKDGDAVMLVPAVAGG
jgi:sulfur-carrier protein